MGKKPDGKPRGRSTSYAFFVKICKEEHEKQNPGVKLDFKEFFKKCSERWKKMLPEDKQLFEEMAQKDKIRYDNEMANYVPPPGENKRKRKQVKDPNAPKRCLSAFFIFCKDERPKLIEEKPDLRVSEVATQLGKMWQLSSLDDKRLYEERAALDRERYEKEMIAFRCKQMRPETTKEVSPKIETVEDQKTKMKVNKIKANKALADAAAAAAVAAATAAAAAAAANAAKMAAIAAAAKITPKAEGKIKVEEEEYDDDDEDDDDDDDDEDEDDEEDDDDEDDDDEDDDDDDDDE